MLGGIKMVRTKRERPLRDAVSNASRTISSSTVVIRKGFDYLNIQMDGLLSEAKLDLLTDSIEQLDDVAQVLGWSAKELASAKAKVIAQYQV